MCTSCTTRITRTTALFLPLERRRQETTPQRRQLRTATGPRLLGTGSQRQLVSTTCRQNRSFVTGGADKARQQLRGRAAVQGRSSDRGTALPPVEPSVPSAPRAREHCVDEGPSARTRAPQLRAVLVQSVVARSSVGRAVACFCLLAIFS